MLDDEEGVWARVGAGGGRYTPSVSQTVRVVGYV